MGETFMFGQVEMEEKMMIATVMAMLPLCGQYPSTQLSIPAKTLTMMRVAHLHLHLPSVMVPKTLTQVWQQQISMENAQKHTLGHRQQLLKLRECLPLLWKLTGADMERYAAPNCLDFKEEFIV